MIEDDSARFAFLRVCLYMRAYVCVMDVLLLSSEARCMLDGIRRRLKKTGPSLSVPPSLSLRNFPPLPPSQVVGGRKGVT